MNRKFHGNGALDQRRYTDLSQSLDSIFKTT